MKLPPGRNAALMPVLPPNHCPVLGVVEEVEGFRAELEPSPLVDGEALEEAEVEVQTSGQCKSVAADIAESESRRGLKAFGL